MPFEQRKRNLEKIRSRGRKNKQKNDGLNAPEIAAGTQVGVAYIRKWVWPILRGGCGPFCHKGVRSILTDL